MSKSVKICLAASAGGHLTQLLKIAQSWSGEDVFFVTTSAAVTGGLDEHGRSYVVGECNRRMPIKTVAIFLKCARIIMRERPRVVISTGAAAGCMLCFLGKLGGAKIIWIDSITNVERLSLSGRMVRHIADLFLVQWPELASKYKKVEFAGTLI